MDASYGSLLPVIQYIDLVKDLKELNLPSNLRSALVETPL